MDISKKITLTAIFDKNSNQWVNDNKLNINFLNYYQNYFNDLLNLKGHVYTTEIYGALGLGLPEQGFWSGWFKDDGPLKFKFYVRNDNAVHLTFDVRENLTGSVFESQTEKESKKDVHNTCVDCGKELCSGDFSYEQKVCWNCFKKRYLEMRTRIADNVEQFDMLSYMFAVVTERFGYKWD